MHTKNPYPLSWKINRLYTLRTMLGTHWQRRISHFYHNCVLDTVIASACSPNRDSIDVGSHKGRFTGWLSQCSRKVYAFDPVQHDFGYPLNGDTSLYWWQVPNYEKIVRIEKALGNESTTSTFYEFEAEEGRISSAYNTLIQKTKNDAWVTNERLVTVEKLDNLIDSDVGFIKCDAEDYDLYVLQGAADLIDRWHPVIVVEAGSSDETTLSLGQQLIDFLRSKQYDVWPLGWPLTLPIQNSENVLLNILAIHQSETNDKRQHILRSANSYVQTLSDNLDRGFGTIKFVRENDKWLSENLRSMRP